MGRIRSTAAEALPASAVQGVAPEVDAVLANWGSWAAARVGVRRQAQAMFRMAGPGSRSGPAVASSVNADEAWRVEKTVCNPEFSPRFRAVLMAHYVLQAPKSQTVRNLGLHWQTYDHELWRASVYFWARYVKLLAVEY